MKRSIDRGSSADFLTAHAQVHVIRLGYSAVFFLLYRYARSNTGKLDGRYTSSILCRILRGSAWVRLPDSRPPQMEWLEHKFSLYMFR